MDPASHDVQLRQAAFCHVNRLAALRADVLDSADLAGGFEFGGEQIPLIYFLGTSPGRCQPIIPTFIVGWHPERLRVDLAFGVIVGASAQATLPASPERRYALREIKARLRAHAI